MTQRVTVEEESETRTTFMGEPKREQQTRRRRRRRVLVLRRSARKTAALKVIILRRFRRFQVSIGYHMYGRIGLGKFLCLGCDTGHIYFVKMVLYLLLKTGTSIP